MKPHICNKGIFEIKFKNGGELFLSRQTIMMVNVPSIKGVTMSSLSSSKNNLYDVDWKEVLGGVPVEKGQKTNHIVAKIEKLKLNEQKDGIPYPEYARFYYNQALEDVIKLLKEL
jgi:hypothetical protein